jgi:hypothetical protein
MNTDKKATRRTLICAAGLLIGFVPTSQAVPYTVQQIAVTPYERVSISVTGAYTGWVAAGVSELLVNGTLTNGFCIDPFHPTLLGSLSYQMVPLTSAPKDDHLIPGAHMTAAEATIISELWGLAYPSIGSDPRKAAALQIAIWEVVGGSQFRLKSTKDYGASLLLSTVEHAGYNGPHASLVALTGPGQDFVIGAPPDPPSVPDSGTTMTLLGLALAGLALFGKTKLARPAPVERSSLVWLSGRAESRRLAMSDLDT